MSEVAQSSPTLCDPWTVACQAFPSMGFPRQEYWNGLPFPSPGDLPDPGIEPGSPALEAGTLTSEPPGKPTEKPMNSMKRQKDRTVKDQLPRSVGAQYATGDRWRNNSRKNEGMEQKQYPVVDVTGDRSKSLGLQGDPTSPFSRRSALGFLWRE